MAFTKEYMLGIDIDIIFQMEKFYLDLNQHNNSPENIMHEISTKYNIPINEVSNQIDVINTVYEKAKKDFLNYYNIPEFESDFKQFFYVESPTDFSLAYHLYLFAQNENPLRSDEIVEGEELDKRKYIIAQILSDDFTNFENIKEIHALTEYLWHYPSSNYKKWISILVLYHARQLTDKLFDLLGMIRKDYSKFKDFYDGLTNIDLYSESNNILLSKLLGDTSNTEVIRVPTVACFNAIKFLEEDYSNRIYVFIGVLYNDIGNLINKHSNNDKVIVSRLKAIGESNRLEILKELKKGPMCGKDIAELLELTPATVSHHMTSLVNEGLVCMYKVGTRVDYKINNEEAQKLINSLQHVFF